MPDDKQPEATSVAEVLLTMMVKRWNAEFKKLRVGKEKGLDDIAGIRAAKDVACMAVIAQQLSIVHARLDTLAQMLGHDVSHKATVAWLKKEVFVEDERTSTEVARVEWVVASKRWRYRIETADMLRTGWLDVDVHASQYQLREGIRKFESGFNGNIVVEKQTRSRAWGRPPLPYAVGDGNRKPWSDHLAGEEQALKHYNLAKEAGIANPKITDKDGNDITQWVKDVTTS